jgi:hypothetical protein
MHRLISRIALTLSCAVIPHAHVIAQGRCVPTVSVKNVKGQTMSGYNSYAVVDNPCTCDVHVSAWPAGMSRSHGGGSTVKSGAKYSITLRACKDEVAKVEYDYEFKCR